MQNNYVPWYFFWWSRGKWNDANIGLVLPPTYRRQCCRGVRKWKERGLWKFPLDDDMAMAKLFLLSQCAGYRAVFFKAHFLFSFYFLLKGVFAQILPPPPLLTYFTFQNVVNPKLTPNTTPLNCKVGHSKWTPRPPIPTLFTTNQKTPPHLPKTLSPTGGAYVRGFFR